METYLVCLALCNLGLIAYPRRGPRRCDGVVSSGSQSCTYHAGGEEASVSGGGLGMASGVESGSGVASRRRVWRLVRQCPLWRLVASVGDGGVV